MMHALSELLREADSSLVCEVTNNSSHTEHMWVSSRSILTVWIMLSNGMVSVMDYQQAHHVDCLLDDPDLVPRVLLAIQDCGKIGSRRA